MTASPLGTGPLKSSKRNSITWKLLAIVFLVLLFMIPQVLVNNLVQERSFRQQNTIAEVSQDWGLAQTVVGPVLAVPYDKKVAEGKPAEIEYAYFLPETLDVKANAEVEIRSRGIYDVPVYASVLKLEGRFSTPNIQGLGVTHAQMHYDDAVVMLGLPDLRGINEQIQMVWNGDSYQFSPGVKGHAVETGVSSRVRLVLDSGSSGFAFPTPSAYDFSIDLNMRGSQALSFMPIGKATTVELNSNWPHPSFDGAFLPTTHEITDAGFWADWKVLDLNRNFPQSWTDQDGYGFSFIGGDMIAYPDQYPSQYPDARYMDGPTKPTLQGTAIADAFGVRLLQPADLYQKTERSAKYGIAVIALVFVVIFFTELTARRKIHPVQYALVGFALVVYYTLLLSLAEYIRFGWAYIIASIAVIGMVTLFNASIMQSWKHSLMGGGVLTLFYGFVYVLLQLTDYALLLGSVALFLILATIMFVSRRIDWYGLGDGS